MQSSRRSGRSDSFQRSSSPPPEVWEMMRSRAICAHPHCVYVTATTRWREGEMETTRDERSYRPSSLRLSLSLHLSVFSPRAPDLVRQSDPFVRGMTAGVELHGPFEPTLGVGTALAHG